MLKGLRKKSLRMMKNTEYTLYMGRLNILKPFGLSEEAESLSQTANTFFRNRKTIIDGSAVWQIKK